MRLLFAPLAALALALGGCATPYGDMNVLGRGVKAEQITADTYRISARGNRQTEHGTITDYILLRAAETTLEAGGTHFILLGSADRSRRIVYYDPGEISAYVSPTALLTRYSPGSVSAFTRPGRDATIRVVTVKRGQAAPAGAISAEEIVRFIGNRVKRS